MGWVGTNKDKMFLICLLGQFLLVIENKTRMPLEFKQH